MPRVLEYMVSLPYSLNSHYRPSFAHSPIIYTIIGVCLRAFGHGEGKRYDLRRRAKSCLCIVTRMPFFSLFRVVLMQIHSLCLLEYDAKSARAFLNAMYNSPIPSGGDPLKICKNEQLRMVHDFTLNTPKVNDNSRLDVAVLPLLEALGVDSFLLIFSALLCEKRIIFVADEINVLSSHIMTAYSMLYPFHWQVGAHC